MKIQRRILCACLLCSCIYGAFAVTSASEETSPAADSFHFTRGQEWSIKSARQSSIKVIIGRVERWRDKVAVHISIVDIPPSDSGAIRVSKIAHIPFEESTLMASVDKLIATGVSPLPEFESGYKQWKDNKGGIFTMPVSQVIGAR
jgi:hypothetical protein